MPPEAGRVLEVLESLDFGSMTPVLQVEFTARSGNLAGLRLPRVVFHADKASYGNVTLRDISLQASYASQILTVQNLAARDDKGGTLAVYGQWNLADGSVEAVFSGGEEDVQRMIVACLRGPRLSLVREVRTADYPPGDWRGFEMWPTV